MYSVLLLSFASLSLCSDNNSTARCRDNQWLCGSECIHRRSFCSLSGSCHPDYAKPCGDGSRCFHRLDSCWEAACLNVNCHGKDIIKQGQPMSELDRTQVKSGKAQFLWVACSAQSTKEEEVLDLQKYPSPNWQKMWPFSCSVICVI